MLKKDAAAKVVELVQEIQSRLDTVSQIYLEDVGLFRLRQTFRAEQ